MNKAKAMLYQVRDEQGEINIIRQQIAQAELALLPSGIRYDTDRVQTSPDDPMLRMAEKVERYEAQLRKHLDKIIAKRQRAFAMIRRLKDPTQRKVLELFFLDERRLSMAQVAEEIGYSERQTFYIYKAAIKRLQ